MKCKLGLKDDVCYGKRGDKRREMIECRGNHAITRSETLRNNKESDGSLGVQHTMRGRKLPGRMQVLLCGAYAV